MPYEEGKVKRGHRAQGPGLRATASVSVGMVNSGLGTEGHHRAEELPSQALAILLRYRKVHPRRNPETVRPQPGKAQDKPRAML